MPGTVIEKVITLMRKLSHPIAAAKFRKHTNYQAKCHTVTGWSSTVAMLPRYLIRKSMKWFT